MCPDGGRPAELKFTFAAGDKTSCDICSSCSKRTSLLAQVVPEQLQQLAACKGISPVNQQGYIHYYTC